jgi:hypothetical protein
MPEPDLTALRHHVLSDPTGRRRRRLAVVGRVVTTILVLWLFVLALGGLGLEPLAGLPLLGKLGARDVGPPRLPQRVQAAADGHTTVAAPARAAHPPARAPSAPGSSTLTPRSNATRPRPRTRPATPRARPNTTAVSAPPFAAPGSSTATGGQSSTAPGQVRTPPGQTKTEAGPPTITPGGTPGTHGNRETTGTPPPRHGAAP